MRRLVACVGVVCVAGIAGAAPPETAAFDKQVRDALGEVHNRGADLYNLAKDYPGAYRLYEGSLRTVRPLLAHRSSVQKRIDAGLAAAEKEADPALRAFLLHQAIEAAREELKAPLPAGRPVAPPPRPKPR